LRKNFVVALGLSDKYNILAVPYKILNKSGAVTLIIDVYQDT